MTQRLIILFLVLLLASPAQAEEYAKPGWGNLLRTLIRFNALSMNDDNVLDEYAAITECDLYKTLYHDDFRWNKARAAIRESIRMNDATFPTSYVYQTELQLDRYDFQEKLFRFTSKTTIRNVNTFRIYKVEGQPCEGANIKLVPSTFRVVIETPLYFEGIPLGEKDAEALLQQMKDDGNTDRVITAHFNMRVVYVDPLRMSHENEIKGYVQSNAADDHTARLDVRLDSVDFYEDQAMTKLIYKLQP